MYRCGDVYVFVSSGEWLNRLERREPRVDSCCEVLTEFGFAFGEGVNCAGQGTEERMTRSTYQTAIPKIHGNRLPPPARATTTTMLPFCRITDLLNTGRTVPSARGAGIVIAVGREDRGGR